jgi:hypothetical protein
MTPDLPFVDEHRACLPHPRERVWSALDRYAARSLRLPPRLALVLGTDPAEGFARTTVRAPERLDLEGRHRFSTTSCASTSTRTATALCSGRRPTPSSQACEAGSTERW